MSNTIQHYSVHEIPQSKLQGVKLNISIDELNSRQNEERMGSLRKISPEDTATVEISELAKAMYSKTAEVCQYSQALEESVNDFADFSMKITYGDYSSNDVSLSDLNFSALDNMENVY